MYLPTDLEQYLLKNYASKSPSYYVMDYDMPLPFERLYGQEFMSNQFVRERGGSIAVPYDTLFLVKIYFSFLLETAERICNTLIQQFSFLG